MPGTTSPPRSGNKILARAGLFGATVLGVAIAWYVIRSIGLDSVADAAHRLGIVGLALVCLYSIGIFVALGAAWLVAAGEPGRRLPRFAAARLVREAVSDFLPLSQIGGMFAGVRVLRAGGIPAPRIYASMIVDQATEMASQLVYTLIGLLAAASLLLGPAAATIRPAVLGGTTLLAAAALAFLFGQKRFVRIAGALARRVLPGSATTFAEVEAELARLHLRRRAVFESFLWNLVAWLASAGASWLILYLIGHDMPLWRLVAIECLISIVRSAAFLVPGAIGFQEAAYALIGPLFGLPASGGLALSLVKRARDVALGLPALLAWQASELHKLARRQAAA